MRKLRIATVLLMLLSLNNCSIIFYKGSGVFKESPSVEYKKPECSYEECGRRTNLEDRAYITMPDNKEIELRYFGLCGGGVDLFGIILPIIPIDFHKNTCEKNGFYVSSVKKYPNLRFNIKYDGKIYEQQIKDYGYIKTVSFPISNFKEFKKAKDKTLIIHKKTKDGKTIIKEVPFEWKIKTHSVVIP